MAFDLKNLFDKYKDILSNKAAQGLAQVASNPQLNKAANRFDKTRNKITSVPLKQRYLPTQQGFSKIRETGTGLLSKSEKMRSPERGPVKSALGLFPSVATQFAGGYLEDIGTIGETAYNPKRLTQAPTFTKESFYDPSKPSKASIALAFAGLAPEVRGSLRSLKGAKPISKFKMGTKTLDELIEAEKMIKFPDKFMGKLNLPSSRTKKEALEKIQKLGAETVDRLSGKHLPDKELTTLKTVEAKIKKLFDLNRENKLANVEYLVKPSKVKTGVSQTEKILKQQPQVPASKIGGLQQTPETIGLDTAGRPSSKYSFNINRKNLGLKGKDAKKLNTAVEKMRPVMEGRRGAPLTNKEIIKGGRKAVVLDEVMGREQAAEFAKRLQATRNAVKSASKQKGVTPQYLAQLDILSSTAADAARKLRSFAVGAEDVGIKELVLKDLQRLGVETDQLIAASKNVDWNDATKVTEFYRKFKPAKFAEKLEEFRYTNMLSSPNTHIINTFSNFLQSGIVAPIEKTLTGGLDFARSRLTGKEQKYFAGQGIDYAKGYWKALPDAWKKFQSVMSGEGGLRKPDIDFIPTGTSARHKLYTTPLRALEGMDQFFRTMIVGGEVQSLKRTGLSEAKALQKAGQTAEYRLFRQAFDPDGKLGQGGVLKIWDKWNSAVNKLRHAPGGKWIVPFLQTPTNILKQGVEYSPLGASTILGSKEPMEQLSKTIIGTGVFTGAYALANSGLTTWDTPTSSKERERFYAAGLQPYSVKIGDNWVSYSKLGPLSYPIAMASAMKWAKDNGATESTLGTIGAGAGGFMQFFADQSYVRGIGDIIDAFRGDEFKQGRALANIPSQIIPYRSLQGWFARLIDPIYRKSTGGTVPEQMWKSILSQIPVLSKSLEPYTTPTGEPSQRHFPLINAVSPLKMTEDRGDVSPYTPKVKKPKSSSISISDAFSASASELPTQPNDLKVLYEDATRIVSGYKDNSSKIRTGLKDSQTLEEAQVELEQATQILKRMEEEAPEQIYKIGLETYESGGGKTTVERAEWASEQLGKAQTQEEFDSWYQGMLKSEVMTKSVLEALREQGLDVNQYVEGGRIKTLGSTSKGKKITLKRVQMKKVKVSKVSVKKITIKPARMKSYTLSVQNLTKPKIITPKLSKWEPKLTQKYTRVKTSGSLS